MPQRLLRWAGCFAVGLALALSSCAPKTAKAPPPPPPVERAGVLAAPVWGAVAKTSGCVANGPLPDRACTPGDILSANTQAVICSASFRTGTVRDSATTPTQKQRVYAMYGIPRPSNNVGRNMVCEIDHLVSLELGGADTMANLWPECSPGYAGWTAAGFRDKDRFENYLHRMMCAGKITLAEAQRQIATDWYRYWVAAGKPQK